MQHLPDTLWMLLARFDSMTWNTAFGSSFILSWPCLIIKVLATWMKFLKLSGYCTLVNCVFTICTTNVFGFFHCVIALFELVKHKFSNYIHCTFICVSFKSHTDWCNAQCVSAPTTKILQTTVSTYNCFELLLLHDIHAVNLYLWKYC